MPSKILTYMCAGRPVLGSIPLENLGARIVAREKAGMVSPPLDEGKFLENAHIMMSAPVLRHRMAANARAYAEKAFNIEALGARFEAIMSDALALKRVSEHPLAPPTGEECPAPYDSADAREMTGPPPLSPSEIAGHAADHAGDGAITPRAMFSRR